MRYQGPSSPSDQLRDLLTRGGMPVTLILLALSVAVFLASFFGPSAINDFLLTHVAFAPGFAFAAPWTLLTYPLYEGGFVYLLIGGFLFWLAGGSLERSWGSRRFSVFFFSLSLVSALSLLAAYFFYTRNIPPLFGFGLPLGGMIVAFCMLNPELTLMFYFFPVRAIYVAWIVAALTYFGAGMGPILNLFACGGIIAAFLYVKFARSWADIGSHNAPRRGSDLRIFPAAKTPAPRRKMTLDGSRRRSAFDLVGRWRDWQVRRKTERLLRNSGFSDNDSAWNDNDEQRPRGT